MEREAKKRDANALSIIQQAVDGPNLDRIAEAKSAHDAWETLRKQCQGTSKVMAVRIQAPRQDFKTLQTRDDEGVQEYISRVVTITNQIKALGHKLKEPEVVSKILRSLAPKFDWVAVAIEESKEISKLNLDDLCGTLQAHEVKVNRSAVKTGEKVFLSRSEPMSSNLNRGNSSGSSWDEGRDRGRTYTHGQGRSPRGRGRGGESGRGRVAECKMREKQQELGANLMAKESEAGNLFMVRSFSETQQTYQKSVWLIDSGCSNHMTGDKSLFSSLDESLKISVRLGDNKEMKVQGVGTVSMNTQSGERKSVHDVQGYSVVFENDECIITNNSLKNQRIVIARSSNNMFPLKMANIENLNVAVKDQSPEEL
ncbi:uncharacterized protein LOC120255359 [Dioscorea cayenensis subsp. rotundata]|uniref:Uncharacterized protein LOC120255359 n=1 Tax=Dioscorea cayennensis subsp. rotundata TaxID=55577 RepID=A0AB40AVH5_DIOCR|nr:uncharacterized protein LOC120255359 [Dioscorea cayenensis subsp. rotundata]